MKENNENTGTEYVLKPKVEAFCRAYGNVSVLVTSLAVIAKSMGIVDIPWFGVFSLVTVPLSLLLGICILWSIGRILSFPGEWFSKLIMAE